MKTALKTLVASVLLAGSSAFAADFNIDPSHSAAQFSVKHMMVSTVRGEFQKISGSAQIDDKDLTKSSVDVTIDAASINTRDAKRDAHLKSPDFFDTEKFPTITFKSTKISKGKGGKYNVTGDLTMHGVTKPVTLETELSKPAKSPWGQTVRGVHATGKLNRKDFGLNWNTTLETGGVLVGDEVALTIDAELVEKAPEAKAATK